MVPSPHCGVTISSSNTYYAPHSRWQTEIGLGWWIHAIYLMWVNTTQTRMEKTNWPFRIQIEFNSTFHPKRSQHSGAHSPLLKSFKWHERKSAIIKSTRFTSLRLLTGLTKLESTTVVDNQRQQFYLFHYGGSHTYLNPSETAEIRRTGPN